MGLSASPIFMARAPEGGPPTPPEPAAFLPLGANSDFYTYWSSDFALINRMTACSDWQTLNSTTLAPGGCPLESIPRDEDDGYPLSLPVTVEGFAATQVLQAILYTGQVTYLPPAGTWVVLWDGTGTILMRGDCPTTSSSTGRMEVSVTPVSSGFLGLVVTASSASDRVRNIRVIPPDLEATFASGQILLPRYVEAIAPFSVLRFMNWQSCNTADNNNVSVSFDWDDRVLPAHYTQNSDTSSRGMALETIVAICNQRLIHPWFCWPLSLSDDYLQNAFAYIRDNLDSRLNAYHELSNEIWNGQFPQHAYARTRGLADGLNLIGNFPGDASDPGAQFWSAIKWQARRSGEVFDILVDVMGPRNAEAPRYTRVIGSMVANAAVTRVLCESFADAAINTSGGGYEHIAVAPYWGVNAVDEIEDNPSMPIGDFMDLIEADAYDETEGWLAAVKTHTDTHSTTIIMYEAGFGATSPDAAAQARILEARRHERMEDCYAAFFDASHDVLGTRALICILGLIFRPNFSGAWGMLESVYQDPEGVPTWEAITDYAALLESEL